MEQLNKTNCPICESGSFSDFMKVKDHMITQEDFQIVSCNACGFHFTNPIPSLETIGEYYKSDAYVSHSSSKKGIINSLYNIVRNYTLKKKVSLLKFLSSGKNLLDIGAGTGHFLDQAKQTGFVVEGLEPDQDAVKFASTNFNVDLCPLSHLYEIENESKDFVTMWHVLEHVYKLKQDFQQIVNVLKKGGYLIIAVPNLESYDAKLYKEFWAAFDVPRHLYHFRKTDIENLAKQFDLRLEQVRPMKFDSYYVSMLSEKYKNGSILKAFWNGFMSNAKSSKGGYSSQIYILRKN